MTDRVELIKQIMVLPTGMSLDDPELRHFAVTVEWRGNQTEDGAGGYAVTQLTESLSRTGNWGWPERYQYRQYRWATLEEALDAARTAVDHVKVRGLTYAEWSEKFGTASEA